MISAAPRSAIQAATIASSSASFRIRLGLSTKRGSVASSRLPIAAARRSKVRSELAEIAIHAPSAVAYALRGESSSIRLPRRSLTIPSSEKPITWLSASRNTGSYRLTSTSWPLPLPATSRSYTAANRPINANVPATVSASGNADNVGARPENP